MAIGSESSAGVMSGPSGLVAFRPTLSGSSPSTRVGDDVGDDGVDEELVVLLLASLRASSLDMNATRDS